MRCWTVDGTGLAGLKMENLRPPAEPGWGEVLVDVGAVALNYRDLLTSKGQHGGKFEAPVIACSDMAGVVIQVGPGVTDLKWGDRVINSPFKFWPAGTLRRDWAQTFVGRPGIDGVLAEQVLYPAASLVKMPSHLSFTEACTLTIAGLSAWAAIVTHGHTRPGEWVLLTGTGGVSVFAAQIAKAIGARTILRTSTDDKARLAREELGVSVTLDYGDQDWPRRVREITGGRGVDVVVEVGGGSSLNDSIKACAYGGRIGVVGLLGGAEGPINVMELILRQVTVRGILVESTQELRAFARAIEANQIKPYIDRVFAFEDAVKAFEHLESRRHFGKVVIKVHAE